MTIKKYFEQNLTFCMKDHGELKKALGHVKHFQTNQIIFVAGNTKGGSITVPLTSCLTGLESAV